MAHTLATEELTKVARHAKRGAQVFSDFCRNPPTRWRMMAGHPIGSTAAFIHEKPISLATTPLGRDQHQLYRRAIGHIDRQCCAGTHFKCPAYAHFGVSMGGERLHIGIRLSFAVTGYPRVSLRCNKYLLGRTGPVHRRIGLVWIRTRFDHS